MALTFANGKITVARTIGGQNHADQLAAAGDAIVAAFREWNLRNNWQYLLFDNSADEIDVVSGTELYTLPTAFREPYGARLLSKNRTLFYVEQREVDRVVRTQTNNGTPVAYTVYRGPNDFNASTDQLSRLKLIPTPDYTATDELLLRYYREATEPSADGDFIDVPDRFMGALLTIAKYYYLVGKDAESARTQEHKERSEFLFRKAVDDDKSFEDHDIRLISQTEYGQAYGYADLPADALWP